MSPSDKMCIFMEKPLTVSPQSTKSGGVVFFQGLIIYNL